MRIHGVDVRVYVLLEHQRGVEPLMMLRLLGYVTRIWEAIARNDPPRQDLPAVVPVLLHNGERGWTAGTSFETLGKLPESVRDLLARHTPHFDALVVDLHPDHATPLKEEWLTASGKLVLWALSIAGDNPRLLAEIDRMQHALAEALAAPNGYEALAALLRHISVTHARLGARRFAKALTAAVGKKETKVMMTILDELEHEGRKKMLLDQLAVKFGAVPAAARARIRAADERTLARWSIRVLSEESLDAVLDAAPPKRSRKAARASKPARTSGA